MKVIDLSYPISREMPVYPGTEPPSFTTPCTIEKDGFMERRMILFTHTGTHLDAPAHIIPGAATIEMMPAGNFCGKASILDFTGFQKPTVGIADLEPHRKVIENNEFVIINTGWSRLWGNAGYFNGYPVLSTEGAGYITGFNLKGFGVDAISVDAVGSTGFPIHRILLQNGIVVIENLTNLGNLPARQFTFCCFPLNLKGSDGSPVRAVAVID